VGECSGDGNALRDHWELQAENWVRWARTPRHDSYWWYRDAFLEILPAPRSLTLDIGCGEGRVTRDLAARGHRTIGIDSSPTLVRYAGDEHTDGGYLVADAAALPFPDGTFDLVVAYCSLMDFDDMPGAVAEASRTLAPGGHFCFSITHPVADAGKFASRDEEAPFVIQGTYFGPRPYEGGTFRRAGLEMTFRGWSHSIEEYSRALEEAGMQMEIIREPQPSREGILERSSMSRWTRLPQFLQVRAVKSGSRPKA
jgi:SAM-dependent methyltransferase